MQLTRLRLLTLALSSLAIACGSPASTDVREPPDVFQRLGLPPSPLPVRWIEPTGEAGGTREYYEDILEYKGDPLDVAVRGTLILTQKPQSQTQQYELTEYHLKSEPGKPPVLVNTVKSSGGVKVESVAGPNEAVAVHRMDGGSAPDLARSFVKVGDEFKIAVVNDRGKLVGEGGFGVDRIATATPQSVEVTENINEMLNWKVRLRVGQELVVHLAPSGAGGSWAFETGSEGSQLALQSPPDGESGGAPNAGQVFRLKAVALGWTDLTFKQGAVPWTFRVKVD